MEVKKGLRQKAKNGGWPQMAPIGYLNERIKSEGSRYGIAKIKVDKERASFIRLAFELYATGDYSLTELTEILEKKGLRSVPTSKRLAKPIGKSSIGRILLNKFYTGIITWENMEFKGNHEPIISEDLFDHVQEVLRIKDHAGERKRKHPHYLRGTVYCGECGAKMSSLTAKGQYLYYYCLGQKRPNGKKCGEGYILASDIEKYLENLYLKIQLPPHMIDELRNAFYKEMLNNEVSGFQEKERLSKKISKLERERQKLLEAFLAEAIPVDMLKTEQQRISTDLKQAQTNLESLSFKNDRAEERLNLVIKVASNCHLAYKKASGKTKRMFNQAFFKGVYIKDKKISKHVFTDLFEDFYSYSHSSNKNHLVVLIRHYLNINFQESLVRLIASL